MTFFNILFQDCRQFELETVQNISYSTCGQNAELYPFSSDICPNSDQREFVVEMLRPEEAKCLFSHLPFDPFPILLTPPPR